MPQLTLRSGVTGFLLGGVLAATALYIAAKTGISIGVGLTSVILAFAMVQVVVHMVYFLHMNPKSEGGWNLIALIFTAVLLVIVLIGTLWVMHHMNTNMMPATHDMPGMQKMQDLQ